MDTDTLYLDFSKAFDKVDHALLIKKLERYGIKGKLLRWIKAFLSNRTQKVVVNGQMSLVDLVLSGVPQGTVLGPLLFLLYVNDLELCLNHSKLKLFADDSRLVKDLHPVNYEDGCVELQTDLEASLKWAQANNMVLNENKFQLLSHHIHSHAPNVNMRLLKQLPFAEVQYSRGYTLPHGNLLEDSEGVTDLGVFVTGDYSFESHINQIARKAHLKCSWILSVFYSREPRVMLKLFKSLVLNIVEYCCPLWSPHRIQDVARIEAVQRRFTFKIAGVQHLNYWDRLKALNLMSLQWRRERYILLYAWKILNNEVPNDVDRSWRDCSRRRKVACIPAIPSRVSKINSTYDHFFKVKAAKLWNCLPKNVNNKCSLSSFKETLDAFILNIQDCPPVSGYTTVNSNSLLDWLSHSNAY